MTFSTASTGVGEGRRGGGRSGVRVAAGGDEGAREARKGGVLGLGCLIEPVQRVPYEVKIKPAERLLW